MYRWMSPKYRQIALDFSASPRHRVAVRELILFRILCEFHKDSIGSMEINQAFSCFFPGPDRAQERHAELLEPRNRMFNVFNGKGQVTETDTSRISAIRVGRGFRIAEMQEFYDKLTRLMLHPHKRTGRAFDSGYGLEELSVECRSDRLLESEDLKKLPASFKIGNDNRKVIDLLYHG